MVSTNKSSTEIVDSLPGMHLAAVTLYMFNPQKYGDTLKKGIVLFRGKALEPPYTMRQKADRIYVNDQQIYPFPQKEQPKPEPTFRIPQKIQDVLADFDTSWQSGLLKDEKGRIKKAASLKREKDLIKDGEGNVMDADFFIQDYESQKKALKAILKSEGIPYKETEKYHDIAIPIEREWGIIALFNEGERIRVVEETDKRVLIPPTYPYRDAAKFKTYVENVLTEGDVLTIDEGVIEFIPHTMVEDITKEMSGFDALEPTEKVGKLRENLSDSQQYTKMKSAVIFLPHFSWQKSVAGTYARYPFSLATSLKSRKYRVQMFIDAAVSLGTWSHFLSQGQSRNMRALYNHGHGNRNIIAVGTTGEGGRYYYFTDQFVYKHANLKKTIVYIYSCYTLSDDRLATAFLNRGACTYGGWKSFAITNPRHSDRRDRIFWHPLLNVNATTGDTCRALNTYDPSFECRGNNRCRLP